MKNILKEICDRRLQDIDKKGFSYGHEIPAERKRPVVPFLVEPGTILEVKRASPSKGDIASGLDSEKTAESYIEAGTSAISVLTEENYFKGTLEDLKKVAALSDRMGNRAAVLRKDFLLEPEEIEIAYRCGADAVLLIARILDVQKLLVMAEKAFSLGISVLLELRDEEAVEKAFEVLKLAKKMNAEKQIVLGVNARDLKTFAIDMLIPLKIKSMIEKRLASLSEKDRPENVRVISESGILSAEAAGFTGSLGFDGILIGEAVARDPVEAKKYVGAFVENAVKAKMKLTDEAKNSFWKKVASKINDAESEKDFKPLVKICGIKNAEDALCAAENGADFLGFIFENKFERHVDLEKVGEICSGVKKFCNEKNTDCPLFVAVITDNSSAECKTALEYYEKGIIDAVQFHGCSGNLSLGYEVLKLGTEEDLSILESKYRAGAARVLLDASVKGKEGGTGVCIPEDLVNKASAMGKLWLAGGINDENVCDMILKFHPELIDVSSGVEESVGKKDHEKIKKLLKTVKNNSL